MVLSLQGDQRLENIGRHGSSLQKSMNKNNILNTHPGGFSQQFWNGSSINYCFLWDTIYIFIYSFRNCIETCDMYSNYLILIDNGCF